MGTVRNLNPAKDLDDFCTFLFGEEVGYVYMPIKSKEGEWEPNFSFEWPRQKQDIIDHVERYSSVHDVYIGPALFSEKSGKLEHVRGANVAWAEFDGQIPTMEMMQEYKVPEPTLRIRSSVPGREHWYWRYEEFQTDLGLIQDINKGLAYALGADTGGWDACQVLRPVGSLNHKREAKHAVTIIRHSSVSYGTKAFEQVPVPEDSYSLEDFNKSKIPNAPRVIARKGPWDSEETDLLFRAEIKGDRSSALMRVAYMCCEKGLTNSEVYALISWCDSRWGKFLNRNDKEQRYIAIINKARVKFPYEGMQGIASSLILPTYSIRDLIAMKDEVDWIIDGILPNKGLVFVVGKSGSGKTIMCTGLCKRLATGGKYLNWEAVDRRPRRVLFLSLEMNSAELKLFFNPQLRGITEAEMDLFDENFRMYAYREGVKYVPLKFYNSEHATRIIATIQAINPDIILVDSATKAIAKDMSAQVEVSAAMELIYKIRNECNASMLVIHHTRKNPPAHGFKEADIDDMFGAQALQQDASAIIAIGRELDKETGALSRMTNVTYLKTRFTGDNSRFTAMLDPETLTFTLPTVGAITSSSPVATPKVPETRKSNGNGSFFNP